jgi:hypothetical protein
MRPRYCARRERSLAAARCTAADFANDCSLAGANWSCTVTAKRPCVCVCVCACMRACMRARTGAIAARARALGLDTGLMASSDGASALDNAASEASSAYTDERRWPQTGLSRWFSYAPSVAEYCEYRCLLGRMGDSVGMSIDVLVC